MKNKDGFKMSDQLRPIRFSGNEKREDGIYDWNGIEIAFILAKPAVW